MSISEWLPTLLPTRVWEGLTCTWSEGGARYVEAWSAAGTWTSPVGPRIV
jgi:hypothetical protein